MYKARDDAQLKQLANEKGPLAQPEQNPAFHIIGDIQGKAGLQKNSTKGNLQSASACIIFIYWKLSYF